MRSGVTAESVEHAPIPTCRQTPDAKRYAQRGLSRLPPLTRTKTSRIVVFDLGQWQRQRQRQRQRRNYQNYQPKAFAVIKIIIPAYADYQNYQNYQPNYQNYHPAKAKIIKILIILIIVGVRCSLF